MNNVCERLFLGDALDAEMLQYQNPQNITAVVNVAIAADAPVDGIINIHIPMEDGEIPPGAFTRALLAIDEHIPSGSVLVHCVMGTSRSVVVVALHLAVTERISFDSALRRIKKLRGQADPAPDTLSSAKRYLEQRNQNLKNATSGGTR